MAASGAADGGYVPERGLEAKPTIPHQRAFLAWRGGQETLIVESLLNAPRGNYAWVVPLPSVPTKVQACTPGTLETVSMLSRPSVSNARGGLVWMGAALLAIVIAALLGAVLAEPPRSHRRELVFTFLALAFVGVVASAMLFPVYASAKMPSQSEDDGIWVRLRGNAGIHSYEVVSAAKPDALPAWLSRNGYEMPSAARSVVEAYARQGWCFAAMKLRHPSGGVAAPHPVRFVFASPRPIYPMRLTGALTSHLRLDLFVVADYATGGPHLEVWRTQTVTRTLASSMLADGAQPQPRWAPIGHPEIVPSLWEAATLTYLRGSLTSQDMAEDIPLESTPKATKDFSKKVQSRASAASVAWGYGLMGAAALALVVGVWRTGSKFGWRSVWQIVLLSIAIAAAPAFAWYLWVPKVEFTRTLSPLRTTRVSHYLVDSLDRATGAWDRSKFPISWQRSLPPANGATIPELDVPGGYTLEKTQDGWLVRVYDRYGHPTAIPMSRDGKRLPAREVGPP